MSEYTIRIDGGDLFFSASHFITFEDGGCEALHGHDFHVSAELSGPLNRSQYVADFVVLREIVKSVLADLDHRVLIPQNHPRMELRPSGDELEIALGARRWVLPREDCLILPVSNTTDEMLARYIAERISEGLSSRNLSVAKYIQVEVRESGGFSAVYHLDGG